MKQILFNTENVKALLKGRKTVTRRVLKPQPSPDYESVRGMYRDGNGRLCAAFHFSEEIKLVYPNYDRGDVLWVRETWTKSMVGTFMYRADDKTILVERWHPSIHMPREAARIFLRVTDVRVERLKDIIDQEAEKEGVLKIREHEYKGAKHTFYAPKAAFHEIWDRTINPIYLELYGWEANPWVWVIEFERISKEEAEQNA